jgi:hypothetical protein
VINIKTRTMHMIWSIKSAMQMLNNYQILLLNHKKVRIISKLVTVRDKI